MARRTVMNESAKWRSGRDRERTVATRPGGRGGKSADAFSDHEGVAAEDDGDVVMPAWEGPPLEVVEPELALEVLVHPLGAPAFLEEADDLLLAHAPGKRGEQRVCWISRRLQATRRRAKGARAARGRCRHHAWCGRARSRSGH